MVRLKKHLGQHLLKDQAAIAAIRDALDPTPEDIVVEIGPGTGNLTASIIDLPAKLIVLEKDQEMIESIKQRFAQYIESGKMEIIPGSALDFDPDVLSSYLKASSGSRFGADQPRVPNTGPLGSANTPAPALSEPNRDPSLTYKLVGNIPYNITGALFEHFLSAPVQPERLVFLIQKEVADRIMARDGKHSILSVSIHIYGTPRMVRKVPAGAFNPPPRVDSAVIAIDRISRDPFIDADHEDLFFHIVKTGFAHPRKFTISNLASFYERATLESVWTELGLEPKVRPEDLRVADWLSISKSLYQDPT